MQLLDTTGSTCCWNSSAVAWDCPCPRMVRVARPLATATQTNQPATTFRVIIVPRKHWSNCVSPLLRRTYAGPTDPKSETIFSHESLRLLVCDLSRLVSSDQQSLA